MPVLVDGDLALFDSTLVFCGCAVRASTASPCRKDRLKGVIGMASPVCWNMEKA